MSNLALNTFRLVWYETPEEDKFKSNYRHEYLGSRESVFTLWWTLTKKLGERHVEIYSLDGKMQKPDKGMMAGISGVVI